MTDQYLYLKTDQEIIDMFDTDLRVTLAELGRMSGRSVKDVKRILMSDAYKKDKEVKS